MGFASELAGIFRHHDEELGRIGDEQDEGAWEARADGAAPPSWHLGRIAAGRRALLRRLGHDLSRDAWETTFTGGGSEDPPDDAPAVDELLGDIRTGGELLVAHLEGMSAEDSELDWCNPLPSGARSTAGALAWYAACEGRDLGRLELALRLGARPSPT